MEIRTNDDLKKLKVGQTIYEFRRFNCILATKDQIGGNVLTYKVTSKFHNTEKYIWVRSNNGPERCLTMHYLGGQRIFTTANEAKECLRDSIIGDCNEKIQEIQNKATNEINKLVANLNKQLSEGIEKQFYH